MRLNIQTKYSLAGTAFGLCFPLAAWSLDLVLSNLAFSPASLILIHQNNYLHYIIDIAPVVLGSVFLLLGRFHQLTSEQISEIKEYANKALLLLNSTGEAIYGIDLNGNCTFANMVCFEMLGYKTEGDLLGKHMHELIHHTRNDGTAYPVDECKIYRAFHEGEGSHVDDEVLWRADGSSFDSEYRSIPIIRDGNILGSVVSFTDISERIQTRRKEVRRLELLTNFKTAMSEIVKLKDDFGDNKELERRFVKIMANALNVDRVSIWYYGDERCREITESVGYWKSENEYRSGTVLSANDYPNYFKSLADDHVIAVTDVSVDPRTSEFLDNYLKPRGITSALNAPILVQGKIVGVLSHQHVGEMRKWDLLEQDFVMSAAISLALSLESRERIKSDNRQKVLLETMVDGLITIDDEGQIESFNPAAEKIFGYSSEEIIGVNLSKLMPEHHNHLQRYKKTGEAQILGRTAIEADGVRKDGSTFPVAISVSEMFIGDRRYFSGVVRDITDRKNLEMEHEQVGAELIQLIQTANAPIFAINTKLQITEWNTAAEIVTGYRADEVMQCLFVDEFIEDASKKEVSRIFRDALGGVETANFELYLRTKKGNISTVLFNTTTRRDLKGNIIGVIGIGQDITDTKLAQAESERIARELTQLVNTANAPIFGIDSRGMINQWNKQAEQISGYSKEEAMGRDMVRKVIIREHQAKVGMILTKAMAGEDSSNSEISVSHRDGGTRLLLFNATAQRDIEGNVTGVIVISQDITELREKENALNQAQKMEAVGQLTGGIAHDFNNLLSIISGNLRFLQQDIGEVDTEIQELFEDAMSAADDGAELTQRLLAFSRTKPLKTEIENVNQLIEKFARFISRTLGENIELLVDLPEDELFVKIDSSQLENALLNLSINARDAMPRGGDITISANRFENGGDGDGDGDLSRRIRLKDKRWIRISVSDTGTGISTEDLAHVFEPFFTTKEVGQGSGLGLSMVYGFMQQSNGECFIESEPGKGTTVSMFLHEVQASTDIYSQSQEADLLLRGSEVILVVEDEPRVRRVTLRDLRNLGYKTLEAENADVARTIIESGEHIDMLFSDVLMPGKMDGHMLGLWTEKHYPNIKVVLTSGYSKGKADIGSERIHPLPMIRKPYTIRKLATHIRTTFSEV